MKIVNPVYVFPFFTIIAIVVIFTVIASFSTLHTKQVIIFIIVFIKTIVAPITIIKTRTFYTSKVAFITASCGIIYKIPIVAPFARILIKTSLTMREARLTHIIGLREIIILCTLIARTFIIT
jgi:hypothetical protein